MASASPSSDHDRLYAEVREAVDRKLALRSVRYRDPRDEAARWDRDEPLSDDVLAVGEWQDEAAVRCHEYDPDATRPHPAGPYWDRVMQGEAG